LALKKVGALWTATKDNKTYMKGTVNEPIAAGAKVFVYRNTFKKEDKQPDYTLHIAVDDQPAPDNHNQLPPEDEQPF